MCLRNNSDILRRRRLNQVARWRRRYIKGGLGALQDEPRSDRKGNLCTEVLHQIVDQATRPPQGRTRLTCRSMARELGVSKATVQRVWSENEIKPHLTRVFQLSSDPDFEAKFWDVIGLYLNPPEQAVVVCCDEKWQIQSLHSAQPTGSGGSPERIVKTSWQLIQSSFLPRDQTRSLRPVGATLSLA